MSDCKSNGKESAQDPAANLGPDLHADEDSIIETRHSLTKLGAVGVGLLSNHEGYYLGHPMFKPFFEAVEAYKARLMSRPAFQRSLEKDAA